MIFRMINLNEETAVDAQACLGRSFFPVCNTTIGTIDNLVKRALGVFRLRETTAIGMFTFTSLLGMFLLVLLAKF